MTGPITRVFLTILAFDLAVGGHALTGQEPRVQLDLSASRIRYDTLATLDAPAAVGLVEWQSPSVLGRVSGGLTGFRGAGWSVQGRGDIAGWMPLSRRRTAPRVELSGGVSGSRHSSGFESFVARSDVRVHLAGRSFGGYGGAGLAVAKSSYDAEVVNAVVPTVGMWAQDRGVRATVQYVHTSLEGTEYPELGVILAASRGPLDLMAYAGFRRSSLETAAYDDEWVGGSVAWWLNERTALTLSAGRYSSDVLQGLPGGDYLSVGVRFTKRRSRPIPEMIVAPIVYAAEDVRDVGITLTVPGADRVEIAGDWNGWQLVPMERVGADEWRVPPGLGPGVYRFNLRVDGERWIVPEGVPEVDGGYGDRVGLLIISEG